MPAQSKQQQKFMGLVHAVQKGDVPKSAVSKKAQQVAKDMDPKDVKDFASTKHKGLPKRIKQEILKKLKEYAFVGQKHTPPAPERDSLRKDYEMDLQKEDRIPQNFNVGTSSDYHTNIGSKKKEYDDTNFEKDNSGQPDLDEQKEMIDGIVEMLNQVEDIQNRKQMAIDRLRDFKQEGIKVNPKEFLQRCGINYSTNENKNTNDVIKDLDRVKSDLLKKVEVLVAKKKKLYSNVDIESPMSADEKKLDKDIADLFSQINQLVLQKRKIKESINEGLYHVGYNKGRGQGTGVFKDSYSSYKDAKKAVEKLEKERGGSYNQIAYYVADKDGKFVRESSNEEKVYQEAQAVSGGKVNKFITGKNVTLKGKKHSEVDFELVGIDNQKQTVKLRILSPKELFGQEINIDFRTLRRGPFLKTDTSKSVNEVGLNDANLKAIQKLYQKAGAFTRKKIAAVITANPNSNWNKIEAELRDSDYNDMVGYLEKLRLESKIKK